MKLKPYKNGRHHSVTPRKEACWRKARPVFLVILGSGTLVWLYLMAVSMSYVPPLPHTTMGSLTMNLGDFYSSKKRSSSDPHDDVVRNVRFENISSFDWNMIMRGLALAPSSLFGSHHTNNASDFHKTVMKAASYLLRGEGDDEFRAADRSSADEDFHVNLTKSLSSSSSYSKEGTNLSGRNKSNNDDATEGKIVVTHAKSLLKKNLQRTDKIHVVSAEFLLNRSKYIRACQGKDKYLNIVIQGSDPEQRTKVSLKELCQRLPTLEQVIERYGPEPIVIGMDTCAKYRQLLTARYNNGQTLKPMPRVAGLYHTGTNALAKTLQLNVERLPLYDKVYLPYDVPWGKHMAPNSLRLTNTVPDSNKEGPLRERVLPIVVIRDPFYWMKSMCKEWYDAKWEKPLDRRCPSIIKDPVNQTTYKVYALLQQTNYEKMENYTSLPEMWSVWNRQYLDADFPRLIIRFEDALYRMDEVMDRIRTCIGMDSRQAPPFQYSVDRAKKHGAPTDFVPALQMHMTDEGRHHGMTLLDRNYTNQVLDVKLMSTFGYRYAPLEVSPKDLHGPWAGQALPRRGADTWWLPGYIMRKGHKLGPVDFSKVGRWNYRNQGRGEAVGPGPGRLARPGPDDTGKQAKNEGDTAIKTMSDAQIEEIRQRLIERRERIMASRRKNFEQQAARTQP